ncbi:MAG: substrate-binding domain-containing protein, partial [Acidovorax sp.]
PAARALATARSNTVVVLNPLLSNNMFVDLLEAVHRTLHPAGYLILIGVTHYRPEEEEALLASYLVQRPAGLLVTGFDRTPHCRKLIEQSGVPCVHLMETSHEPEQYCVGFSQTEAGQALTDHLLQIGRRHIAFAAAQLDPRVMQRMQGYRQSLSAAGCYDPALELLNPKPSSKALGGELLETLLREHPEVDAIFFCNDDLAQGGLLTALRLGIKVPQQVAVAGFNDLDGSEQMWPPLTTIHTPRVEIGMNAASMLLSLMRGEPQRSHCVDVGWELLLRQSTLGVPS